LKVTLVISGAPAAELLEASRHPLETAGVLRAVLVQAPNGDLRLLTRAIDWVSERAYVQRESNSLGITSDGYVPSLGKAEAGGEIAIWLHTHPGDGAAPQPSLRDHRVDDDIRDIFQLRTGSGYYGTLIISPHDAGLAFTGTLQHEDGRQIRIDRLWDVSDTWSLTRSFDNPEPPIPAMFNRNVRAFGGGVQLGLGALQVGIVGCGGTGSAVAEQLARLGVRHLHLIDPDELSSSNVTRVYGSFPHDVGKPKVEIVRRHLSAIAPDIECSETVGMVTDEKIARQLISCDVIFGCTDDNAGRMVLSRIASYLMRPSPFVV
jgi:ThiF family